MINLLFRYDQTSVRLEVLGLPDQSIGQKDGTIGILSSWKLELLGRQELEGKREHLQSLMKVVMQYSRHCVSGIRRSFGDEESPVTMSPCDDVHQLIVRSSKEGVEPLKILIDDAELSDLTRCLDDLRQDTRVELSWNLPPDKPIRIKTRDSTTSFVQLLIAPLAGATTLVLITSLSLLMPLPEPIEVWPLEKEQTS